MQNFSFRKLAPLLLSTAATAACFLVLGFRMLSTLLAAFTLAYLLTALLLPFLWRRDKEALLNAQLLSSSLIFALVLAEVLLRVFFPHKLGFYLERTQNPLWAAYVSPFDCRQDTWYHLYHPGREYAYQNREFRHYRRINSLGLPERELILQKTSPRILCLGDSFTEGIGAPYDSSYPSQLDRLLPPEMELINGGVSGSDLFFSWKLFEDTLAAYQPDLLVFLINSSDIDDLVFRLGDDRFLPGGRQACKQGPWWEPLMGASFVFRLLRNSILRAGDRIYAPRQWQQEENRALDLLQEKINRIAEDCRRRQIDFLFVLQPSRHDLKTGTYHPSGIQELIAGLPEINRVDLLSFFLENQYPSEELYWPVDQHFSPTGYRRVAEAIQGRVLQLIQDR